MSLRPIVLATLCVLSGLGAQSAGSLRFSGSAALGESVEVRVANGPVGAPFAVLMAPEIGGFTIGTFASDCLTPRAGVFALDVVLNGLGAARTTLVVPADPMLVGTYFAAQGLALRGGILGTNCASFVVVAARNGPDLLETFDTTVRHAPGSGAAEWAAPRPGVVRPGRLGGSGALGSFDPSIGVLRDGVRVFSTDDQVFPGAATLRGVPVRVTDGRFEFLDFVIPAGVTVRFEGSRPARILVAGDAVIDGVLDIGGVDLLAADGDPAIETGVPGGAPGPGGGPGGAGGDRPTLVEGSVDGRPGGELGVLPGTALAGFVADTGGRGSPGHPPAGDPAAVTYRFLGLFSNQIASGGGGGGFLLPGSAGRTLAERAPGGDTGPAGSGGRALAVLRPVLRTRADKLIGGAGGGGGGAHPYDSVAPTPRFVRGEAGAGGGGALLIVAGGEIRIGTGGVVRADGGSAAARSDADGALLAPGGGGSGGTVLFQAQQGFRSEGLVTVGGGRGGVTEDLRATPGSRVVGGDGAAGRVLVEVPDPARDVVLGTVEPADAARVDPLDDSDDLVVATSAWIPLPATADPAMLTYELYAVQDAVPTLWSDRLGVGSGPARRGVSPIVCHTRFVELDGFGEPVPGTEGAWAEGSAAAPASANAIRFALLFERGGHQDLRVEAVRLVF